MDLEYSTLMHSDCIVLSQVDVSYCGKFVVIQHLVDSSGNLTFELHASLNALHIRVLPRAATYLLLRRIYIYIYYVSPVVWICSDALIFLSPP